MTMASVPFSISRRAEWVASLRTSTSPEPMAAVIWASSLKLVNVIRDSAVIEAAHADAAEILQDDPRLERLQHRALAREVRMMRGNREVMGG